MSGNIQEHISNIPKLFEKENLLTNYVDAKLMFDVLISPPTTVIIHNINETPIDWFFKKQSDYESNPPRIFPIRDNVSASESVPAAHNPTTASSSIPSNQQTIWVSTVSPVLMSTRSNTTTIQTGSQSIRSSIPEYVRNGAVTTLTSSCIFTAYHSQLSGVPNLKNISSS